MNNDSAHKPSSGFFFPFLDGLRGVAVLSVVLHHSFYFNPSSRMGVGLNGLLNAGRLGVAIFFVMSGFLMGLVVFDARQPFDWSGYACRRIGKILPPFVISLLVASALWIPFHGVAGVPFTLFADLTTLANFLGTPNEMNPIYWSLFIEIHFYIILPLIYLALRRFTKTADIWTCFLFFAPMAVRALMYWWGGPSYRRGYGGFQVAFPLRLDAFAPGVAFAAYYLRRRNSPASGRGALALPWVGLALLGAGYLFYGCTHSLHKLNELHDEALFMELAYVLTGSGTALVLFLCFGPSCLLGRIFGSRLLGFLGLISYEWYLFHYPPKLVIRNFFPHSQGSLSIYAMGTILPVAVSLSFSALVYYRLSAPILNYVKRLTRGSRISKGTVVAQFCGPQAAGPELKASSSTRTTR